MNCVVHADEDIAAEREDVDVDVDIDIDVAVDVESADFRGVRIHRRDHPSGSEPVCWRSREVQLEKQHEHGSADDDEEEEEEADDVDGDEFASELREAQRIQSPLLSLTGRTTPCARRPFFAAAMSGRDRTFTPLFQRTR